MKRERRSLQKGRRVTHVRQLRKRATLLYIHIYTHRRVSFIRTLFHTDYSRRMIQYQNAYRHICTHYSAAIYCYYTSNSYVYNVHTSYNKEKEKKQYEHIYTERVITAADRVVEYESAEGRFRRKAIARSFSCTGAIYQRFLRLKSLTCITHSIPEDVI